MRERARLARSRPRQDHQRPVDDVRRRALVRIETCENAFFTSPWRGEVGAAKRRREGVIAPRVRCLRLTPPRIAFGDPTLPLQGRVGVCAYDRAFFCWRFRPLAFVTLRLEQHRAAGAQPPQFALLEQPDHAVLAVVAGLADHLAGAQARDRLGEQRGRGARNILDRHRLQDRQFRSERRDQAVVAARDRLARRPAGVDLGQHFGERHQAFDLAGGGRRHGLRFAAVGQHLDPVQHADRHRLAAHRAAPAIGERLARGEPRVAFAVAIEVIFAFLGEELHRARVAGPGLQRVLDGEIIHLGVERRRLAAEFLRRMRVGIRHQPVAIEKRQPPVHRRIGRQPGLHREDVRRQVAVARDNRVEARLRAERGEPRRPDMCRHQVGVGPGR